MAAVDVDVDSVLDEVAELPLLGPQPLSSTTATVAMTADGHFFVADVDEDFSVGSSLITGRAPVELLRN